MAYVENGRGLLGRLEIKRYSLHEFYLEVK